MLGLVVALRAPRRGRRADRGAVPRRAPHTRARTGGAAASTNRPRSAPWRGGCRAGPPTTVPSPTLGSPASRAASSVSNRRVRVEADLARRQVRSWLAAWMIHSSSRIASFSSVNEPDRGWVEQKGAAHRGGRPGSGRRRCEYRYPDARSASTATGPSPAAMARTAARGSRRGLR